MKILITGPTSGTGRYLANALAPDNDLILVGRNQSRLEDVESEVKQKASSVRLYAFCDFSDYWQVKQMAGILANDYSSLDVFISNAGVLGKEKPTIGSQGYEFTFMTNYLSHYLLQARLLGAIRNAKGKIFNMCSVSHSWYPLDYSDLMSLDKFQPMKAYGRSKKMLLQLGLATSTLGIDTFNIDPGTFRSGIARSRAGWFRALYSLAKIGMRTPATAAADIVNILNGQLTGVPSGAFLKSGKVKELPYTEEEIGKLIDETSDLCGVDIRTVLSSNE